MVIFQRAKLCFDNQEDYDSTRRMMDDHHLSYSNVFNIGKEIMFSDISRISGLQYKTAYLDAFIYQKMSQKRTLVPWKVVKNKGKKENLYPIKIYKMEKLERNSILIIYSDENTEEGKYKCIKKVDTLIDNTVLSEFF